MKNSQKSKLLFMLGLMDEFIENPDENTKILLILKSGKKSYKAEIFPSENSKGVYVYHATGKENEYDKNMLKDIIADEAIMYDETQISFINSFSYKTIIANDRGVTIRDEIEKLKNNDEVTHISDSEKKNAYSGISLKRDYFIKINEASNLLKAIGIIDENHKLRNDRAGKYNQIDRFVEFAVPYLKEAVAKGEKITILDLGCGKSYLSFVLYYYITEKLNSKCEITGLDRMESVIKTSNEIAKSLGYKDMRFITTDLEQYVHKSSRPTLCISLHACDAATDYAIFAAIKTGSKAILCVPCCHSELLNKNFDIPNLRGTILKHNALKEKFSALFTDSIRMLLLESCGYKVSITEYISPLDTPKNLLIRASYIGNKNEAAKSIEEYRKLKTYGCNITLGNLLEREGIIK